MHIKSIDRRIKFCRYIHTHTHTHTHIHCFHFGIYLQKNGKKRKVGKLDRVESSNRLSIYTCTGAHTHTHR